VSNVSLYIPDVLMNFFNFKKVPAPQIVVTRGAKTFTFSANKLDKFNFQSGDEIAIHHDDPAVRFTQTPDGCTNIAVGDKRFRLPPKIILSEHLGYLLPEHLVVLTGAGTETLSIFGKAHVANYQKFMGIDPDMTILEIGCGIGRDAFQFMDILSDKGSYVGIDVTWDSINWCQKNIRKKRRNFRFYHFDAQHELYNPLGQKTSLDFSLPVPDHSVDRICAGSVFTHLFEDEVVHYLKEIARVLKPGGLAYTSVFLYSAETVEASRINQVTHNNLRFEHPYADGCFVNDPAYPTGAVAYTQEAINRMIHAAGLTMTRPLLKGAWSGLHANPDDGQEVAIVGIP